MSGIFGSSQWMYNSGADFYNGVATQSLRFDDGSSAYLTFTTGSASSATDRRKVTHSVWVKRGVLGADQTIYSGNRSGGGDYYLFRFSSDNKLTLILDVDTGGYGYDTSAVFRDVGAWYHVCVIIDTTQATDTDRVKIYVNGVLQDKTTKYAGGHVAQNFSTYVMDGSEDEIGRFAFTDASYFDGYMAEFITTIGQDNTISEFGELKNGVWIPIDYAGSYGGNGFRLQFNQTGTGSASSSTIGADTSGNDNHFSSSGIVASDCDMPDSPENNFCTLNPLNTGDAVLSEGNLKTPNLTTDTNNLVASTFQVANGKWYWEFLYDNVDADYAHIGITQTNGYDVQSFDNYLGYRADQWSIFAGNGNKRNNQSFDSYGSGFSDNDIGMIALDMDNNKIWWGKNGTWFNSGDPASGTNAGFTNLSGEVTPALSSRDIVYYNFGQDSSFVGNTTAQGNTDGNGIGDFYYSPPSGYLALCTANLPEPTISPNEDTQADDYFNTVLYTGNGSTGHAITGVGFQPDWTWIKGRSYAGYNYLVDSVRGYTERLFSNLTDGASVEANTVTSSDSDGFTVGSDAGVNNNTSTYVAWNWKAGGTAVSNTNGSITSSVSVNTDAGFSIVSYTGASGNQTVGHSLGKKPQMILFKKRTQTSNWNVLHHNLSSNDHYLILNSNSAQINTNTPFNNTAPTTSVFSIGDGDGDVNTNGENHIAYCFAEIEGYSKFGSYTGNGNADGTFVYTGFSPAFVIIKDADTAGYNWYMYDNLRKPYNNNSKYLIANTSGAEIDYVGDSIDHLSNGFKLRTLAGGRGTNRSNINYIYMAFAENPFKYANAR